MLYQQLLALAILPKNRAQDYSETLVKMFNLGVEELKREVDSKTSRSQLMTIIERIDNTFNLVGTKTGEWFLKDSFSCFLKEHETLKKLFEFKKNE